MTEKKEGSDQFVSNVIRKEIIFLKVGGKPIGRYCELPGCNKRLVGKIVTRKNWRTGLMQNFELPVLRTQKYCCESHKTKAYDIRNQREKTTKTAVDCRIRLTVQQDQYGPYRDIILYMKKGFSVPVKIRKENKELWTALNKIAYYRNKDHKEKIKPMNLLSLVNIQI